MFKDIRRNINNQQMYELIMFNIIIYYKRFKPKDYVRNLHLMRIYFGGELILVNFLATKN